MAAPAHARISIIGAGPGDLACARVLQRHGIPVTVYDRDPDGGSRNQGGSLDLHEEDGQLALREAGLLAEFFALARFEGQEMRRLDPAGNVHAHHVPDEGDMARPEIDRGQLRDLLLRSLDAGTVQWGRTLASVSGPADGPRTLTFTDGTAVEADLVIGADGAFSRVRTAVSPATPRYTGVSFLEAWFDDMENAHPELAELVGKGSAHAADGERGLFAQRNSGGHMRVHIMQRVPADWIAANGLRPDDTEGIRAHLLGEYAAWSPQMLRMISDNDGAYVDRPLLALPVPHTWEHSPAPPPSTTPCAATRRRCSRARPTWPGCSKAAPIVPSVSVSWSSLADIGRPTGGPVWRFVALNAKIVTRTGPRLQAPSFHGQMWRKKIWKRNV
jgi:2-polyprenyl-6-methoxyphenol hydroxylase-like FAD-dependent oxidoreductase